jgi:type II secretory pathway component PulK
VLIAVLIVIVVLSLAAYRYSDMMIAEYRATDRILRNTEAKALADSGVHYTAALLADKNAMQTLVNPFNNDGMFRDRSPYDDSKKGRFSIVSFDVSADSTSGGSATTRYGVLDESGKLNLNTVVALDPSVNGIAYKALMNDTFVSLGMTDDIAQAIIDWIKTDTNPLPNGAKDDYYMSLNPPYHCKNGPLNSIEELLLVKGVTPLLLFGNDLNRNGIRDPEEETGGDFSFGIAPFLTIYSRELNVDSSGNPRINLNGNDLKQLYSDLKNAIDPNLAAYLVAYRIFDLAQGNQQGASIIAGSPGNLVTLVEQAFNNNTASSKRTISSVMTLIGSRVSYTLPTTQPQPKGKAAPPTIMVFSFSITDANSARTSLPSILDKTTTKSDTELPGRINVTTAPREVLNCLPGLEAGDVDLIINHRPSPDSPDAADPIYSTTAWLYTEANLAPAKLQALESYVTARTQVYRFQSIGYFDKSGPVVRIEAVVDTNQGLPRILYYRDLTELGRAIDPRSN